MKSCLMDKDRRVVGEDERMMCCCIQLVAIVRCFGYLRAARISVLGENSGRTFGRRDSRVDEF